MGPLREESWFKVKERPSCMLFKPDWFILTIGECQLGVGRSAVESFSSHLTPDQLDEFWRHETVNLEAAVGRLGPGVESE